MTGGGRASPSACLHGHVPVYVVVNNPLRVGLLSFAACTAQKPKRKRMKMGWLWRVSVDSEPAVKSETKHIPNTVNITWNQNLLQFIS